nr:MAG TPA: hypothetical protein [Caudoviricetes sp.]
MGILNFNASSSNVRAASTDTAENRDPSKLWINIGYEKNGKFVNLPFGTPIDTMKPAKIQGQNEDWVKFQTARNQFLSALQDLGKGLEPGQDMELPSLIIKMHRVAEKVEVAPEDNEYAVDLGSLFAAAAE